MAEVCQNNIFCNSKYLYMCVHTGKQEKNKRAKALLRYHVPSRGKVGTNNYNFFQQFGKESNRQYVVFEKQLGQIAILLGFSYIR